MSSYQKDKDSVLSRTILVVDDNVSNLGVMSQCLKENGYRVLTAKDGRSGLEKVQTGHPDLILMDVMMPGIDGFETCRRLKADKFQKKIPVIFMTALTNVEDKVKGFQVGGVDYITKPFQTAEVLARVKTHIELRELSDRMEQKVHDRTHLLARSNKKLIQEIAAHKIAEEELRRSETRYRLVMEACPEPIVVYDMEGQVQYLNLAFTRVFGWELHELIGKRIPYVPKENQAETDRMLEILKKGEMYFGFETQRYTKTRDIVDVSVSWGVWREQNDKAVGSVVVLCDVTKKKMLKKQLLQAQKMESIGSLAGGIAHDFNNLLSPILGYSQLLLDTLPTKGREQEHVQRIFDAGMRASKLTKQILTISRQSFQETVPVTLQPILQEVVRMVRATLPKSIEILEDIQSDCGAVMADPTQLHQVVMNLVTNAYHAVDEIDGKILLSLSEVTIKTDEIADRFLGSGTYVLLTVADNGTGISPEILERIFDPYFTTKEEGKGTGLGLSIVYGIVKELKGNVKVDSETGEGTTFNIYIPVIVQTDDIVPKSSNGDLSTGTEHILVVDDEEPIISLAQETLEALGYTVTAFESSVNALETFMIHPDRFDLVVTDMTMPGLTGPQLAEKIHSIKQSMPIIMCTGLGGGIDMADLKKIGVKRLLRKPLLDKDLAKSIREVLSGKD